MEALTVGIPDVPPKKETNAAGNLLERGAARRRTARQACIALLTGAALFAVLQIAAAVALELWFPGAIDPDYGGRFWRIAQGRAAEAGHSRTVVMLGSSRTYYGLDAGALNAPLSRELGRPVTVVNFGFTGAGPVTELLMWRRLRQDAIRPDLVLVEVLPGYLSSSFPVDETSEAAMPADRLRWHDLALLERYGAGRARPRLRRDLMEAAADTLYSRRLGIVNAIAPELLSFTNTKNPLIERRSPDPFPAILSRQQLDKALAYACREQLDKARDSARRDYTPFLADFHLGGRGCEALRELLASCRQAHVPAALVLMPEGPQFRSWYPPETWRQIQNWVELVCREEGAPLINAREWIEEDDFVDSHHLLPRGADKFTCRLGREYILPLLRRLPDEGKPPHGLAVRPSPF
jgi:hypothetical protein